MVFRAKISLTPWWQAENDILARCICKQLEVLILSGLQMIFQACDFILTGRKTATLKYRSSAKKTKQIKLSACKLGEGTCSWWPV